MAVNDRTCINNTLIKVTDFVDSLSLSFIKCMKLLWLTDIFVLYSLYRLSVCLSVFVPYVSLARALMTGCILFVFGILRLYTS
jgi:hypothetical protein